MLTEIEKRARRERLEFLEEEAVENFEKLTELRAQLPALLEEAYEQGYEDARAGRERRLGGENDAD